ncbi:Uncharacterised protein [Bordetella pertussis]|nr:Uncharacterised protein [Bordetella pertussis]
MRDAYDHGPACVEFHGARLRQDPGAIEIETRTVAAFGEMGFKQCNNCIIYQTHMQPGLASTWGGVTQARSFTPIRFTVRARTLRPGRRPWPRP